MNRFVLAFAAAAAVSTLSASASAQAWLRDRRASQGPGVRAGDLELHPGIAAEVGYDSNFFNRAPDRRSAGYPVVDTVLLRITPSFHVSTLSTARRADGTQAPPPKVIFDAGAAFAYQEFLTNTEQLGRSRQYSVLADALLHVAPRGPWGFLIRDNFQRTAQPSLDPFVEAGLNRIENRAAAEIVHTRPGGLFDWRVGYAFANTHFEEGPAQQFNNIRHEAYTRGYWRFLPRTAFVYDGQFWFITYNDPSPGRANSHPVRTRAGINGLLTDRLSLLAMAGWGASFYANAGTGTRDFDSVIGQLELRYFFHGAAPEPGQVGTPAASSIALGFTRDFNNSYLGNFYDRNRGYISVNAVVAHRFYFGADAGFAAVRYADILDRETGALLRSSFTNGRLDAMAFAEYRVTDWLGVNVTGQYFKEFSDVTLPVSATNPNTYALGFDRVQVFGGLRAFY